MRVHLARVIDGDTIRVLTKGGRNLRVRLLGIDAPELSTTRTGSIQCGSAEAAAALSEIARPGEALDLQFDAVQPRRDRFGRLLAAVIVPGERATVQEALLRDGWARVYSPDDSWFVGVDEFHAAADDARKAKRGVWRLCGGDFQRSVS